MRAGISLGSNLGDRRANLLAAMDAVAALSEADEPVLRSRIYETQPVDCPPGSPNFVNAAMEIAWSADPLKLLEHLQAIESRMGRPAIRERNAPRPIDLDVLYCGEVVLSTPRLTLPHPRIRERRFVLEPLNDIVPHLILPKYHKNISDILDQSLK